MRLSFCIPTYNHGQFLGAALDSILAHAPQDDFEIVIVDGASTDNTAEVVAEYQRKSPAIVYARMPVNRGIDPDIAESVARARGDYCWLMSSDDVLAPRAVEAVLRAVERQRSLYLGARLVCTKDMQIFGEEGVFTPPEARTWDFSSDAQLADYLNRAAGLIALFSYISVLIVRRDLWLSHGETSAGMGSCYAHAYRLWAALAHGGTVEFLGAPLAMCRTDTDHFSKRGVFRRFMLDFDGYLGIANDVFGARPEVRQAFLAAIRREHGLFRLARFYHGCVDASERRAAMARLRSVEYSRAQLLGMRVVAGTGPLVKLAVELRRNLRRLFGPARLRTS